MKRRLPIADCRLRRSRGAGALRTARGEARSRGFTLLEVMIAAGILFMCLFAIFQVMSVSLKNARSLQRTQVDAGLLAVDLALTNQLAEGTESGDFGDLYQDYRWTREITEVGTNGLYQVDFTVYRRGAQNPESRMSVLYFKPNSAGRGMIRPR